MCIVFLHRSGIREEGGYEALPSPSCTCLCKYIVMTANQTKYLQNKENTNEIQNNFRKLHQSGIGVLFFCFLGGCLFWLNFELSIIGLLLMEIHWMIVLCQVVFVENTIEEIILHLHNLAIINFLKVIGSRLHPDLLFIPSQIRPYKYNLVLALLIHAPLILIMVDAFYRHCKLMWLTSFLDTCNIKCS